MVNNSLMKNIAIALCIYIHYWFWYWLSSIFSLIFNFKPVIFYQTLRLLLICIGLYIFSETIANECSAFHMAPHIYGFSRTRTGSRHGSWHSLVCILVGPSEFNESSTLRLALEFTSAIRFSPNHTHLTCRNFICQQSAITETTVKQHPFCSPTGGVMGCERVYEISGLSDLADLAYINLDKQSWRQPNSWRGRKQPPLPAKWNVKIFRVKCYFHDERIT